jgi:hypothetical protein
MRITIDIELVSEIGYAVERAVEYNQPNLTLLPPSYLFQSEGSM